MKKPRAHVTDHAVISYLERVLKIDVEAHRREIGRKVDHAMELGASSVLLDGMRYHLRDGKVTTVMPKSSQKAEPEKRGQREFGE